MVKLDIIRKSDAQLGEEVAKFTPVALFVGATNGVGRDSIKHFAKSTILVNFVGQSRERGEQLRSELTAINSDGYYVFISADVSLMTAVDDVCQVIMKKEQYLNLLFMSQANTQKLPETLPSKNAISYCSRAPILRRCVFVFGSSLEGKVVTDDLDGRNISLLRNRNVRSSVTTLAIDKLSQEDPEIS
ncbi:Oxidoreductase andH [Talaromyces pinophilus]|nr:Oxidoreductase andH [Talaromyces pinophilus]